MQPRDIRTKNIIELRKELENKKKELEKYMSDVYKGKEKNLQKAKFFRKDIARIKTVIMEKEILKETDNA